MSALIQDCVAKLSDKMETVAKTEGKIDAKMWVNQIFHRKIC